MTNKQLHAVSLPLEEYRLPIYIAWDKAGHKCPHNSLGWVAYHNELVAEKFLETYDEITLDLKDNS
jgi:hypothetical protein